MHGSKLLNYLKCLTRQELNQFRDFVNSPFYNKHVPTRKLMNFLLEHRLEDTHQLTKQRAFKYVFGSKPYEEQLLSNVISYLLKLLRKFYAVQWQAEQSLDNQLALLENALQHHNENLFQLGGRKLKKQYESSAIRDSHFYNVHHRFNRLQDDFDLSFGKRIAGNYLEEGLKFFQFYTIGEQLKMACQMLARKQVTGRDYDFTFLKKIIEHVEVEKVTYHDVPSVWLYLLIYKMMTNVTHDFYYELKERLKKEVQVFSYQEGRDLYTHALNYCIGQLNLGGNEFRRESFDLYREMLDNKLLLKEEQLPQWDFTNIVALGCELKEYEWVNQFIENYKDILPPSTAINTYTYNLAAFYFAQKEYEKATGLLSRVEFTDMYYSLITRILLMKIYFEQQAWQALDYSIENFRIFLLRTKKMEERRRKSALNLIRFTRQLATLSESQVTYSKNEFSKKVQSIQTKIMQNKLVLNRSWLLEQVEKFVKLV